MRKVENNGKIIRRRNCKRNGARMRKEREKKSKRLRKEKIATKSYYRKNNNSI